ncbi:MAG: DUF4197 domain-containing protein [Nitrospira sp.]|nr:DUF4197 domain-containing protein [Nitrospira sp.]
MKIFIIVICILLINTGTAVQAGFLDDLFKGFASSENEEISTSTLVKGLKEALDVGTRAAVRNVSAPDGYMGNEAIKILMPDKIQKVADVMRKVGFGGTVDEFVTSMNRAAENAAPVATEYFIKAIKSMTIQDARKILNGSQTAATEYFKEKTYSKLYDEFKPGISSSMDKVGTVRSYKAMLDNYSKIPFVKQYTVDLDDYVTNKSLEGLFHMIGQEEMKIRSDPAARVSDILRTVFAVK